MSDSENKVTDEPAGLMASMTPTTVAISVIAIFVINMAVMHFLRARRAKEGDAKSKSIAIDNSGSSDPSAQVATLDPNTVSLADIAYIANQLSPTKTTKHLDVLFAVASAPESLAWGLQGCKNVQIIRQKREERDREELRKKNKDVDTKKTDSASSKSDSFDFSDDGWADDADEDDDEDTRRKAKLAAEAEAARKKEREQLQLATGQAKILLEGIDDGVLGRKWVEKVLAKEGAWPPKDLGILKNKKFEYEGQKVAPLDHPGLSRNLCMIMGRLNSRMLNAHTELLEANSKNLIDQTYFKGTQRFRTRVATMLEASLRTAVACRAYDLASLIVETVAMFKIGCDLDVKPKDGQSHLEWFDGVMMKTYNCLPRLSIGGPTLEVVGYDDIATGDTVTATLDLTRVHAENFTQQKIAMFKKQGLPPQVALQTYREGWWFLVSAERIDGGKVASLGDYLPIETDGILQQVDEADITRYDKELPLERRLVTAWPMVVQNVAQKAGKVKIQFKMPPTPGKYRFTIRVKSQDFLGADQEITAEVDVVDKSTVDRTEKPVEVKE